MSNIWISFLITKNYTFIDSFFLKHGPKFKKYFALIDLKELLLQITYKAKFIEVKSKVTICRDKKDNFLLALAKDGKATHLITGDKDLLDLKNIGLTKIITLSKYTLS